MTTARRDGLLRAAAMISILTIITRVAGFVRVGVFSATVGANQVGNAYNTVNALPNVVFEVAVGGAMAGAVVPLLAGPFAAARRTGVPPTEASRTASAITTWVLIVLTPLAVALALFATPIAHAMIPDPYSAALGARLLTVFALQVPLYGLAVALGGVLQADRRFLWPALAPLLNSVIVIGGFIGYWHATAGQGLTANQVASKAATWLGWGTTAGVAALSLPLLIPTLRAGIRLRPTLHFGPGIARRVARLASAGLVGVFAQQASVLVVIAVANYRGGDRTMPMYTYIQACYLLPYAVLALPLVTSAFPRLAELVSDRANPPPRFARLAALNIGAVVAAGIAGSGILIGLAPAIEAVFASLDRGHVAGLGAALVFFAPGVIGMCVMTAAARCLYALERGREAGATTAIGWLVLSVGGGVVALAGTGRPPSVSAALGGLGLAFSVGMGIAALLGCGFLVHHLGWAVLTGLPRSVAVTVVGAIVGAGAARGVIALVPHGAGLGGALMAAAAAGVAALALVAATLAIGDRRLLHSLVSGAGT